MFCNNHTHEAKASDVIIEGVDAATFLAICRYLYTDRLEIADVYDASRLLQAADLFLLPALKEKCVRVLNESIDDSHFLSILALADRFGLSDLKAKCLRYALEEVTSETLQQQLHEFVSKGQTSIVCELLHNAIMQRRKKTKTSPNSSRRL